jgi:hypothetical protein
MINELKEALAAHPENPFLQGHVSALENLPNCRNCTHCSPSVGVHGKSGITLIRCNHPDWGDEDTEMREIDPTFGEMCADYSEENDQAIRREAFGSAPGSHSEL